MKLCKHCRRTLPLLIGYVLFLSAFLTFLTGLVTSWHPVAVAGVFIAAGAGGTCYVTRCSCRLCQMYRHHKPGVTPV